MADFPGEWLKRAACKGQTELFFPERTDRATKLAAIAVCNPCRVKAECKAYALEHNVRGIWAGMTRDQLRDQRRQLGIEPKRISIFADDD